MASINENNYKTNPYVYDVVNAVTKFCRDYDDAQKALAKNPKDIRAAMIRAYCMEFTRWLSLTTRTDFKRIGETMIRMMEVDDEK